jgi:hypothetical protein
MKLLVVHDIEEPRDALIRKGIEEYGIIVVLMRDIISDLKEEVQVAGSRDDVMRFVELIAFESRESYRYIRKMLETEAKKTGLDKTELWPRLMKLMQINKRTELLKQLKIDKKTTTQTLRENA